MKLSKNTNGFTAIEVLLVILTLTIVGGAGYLVAKHIDKKNPVVTTAHTSVTPTKKTTTTQAPVVDPTASWTAYSSQQGAFSLRYPTSWVQPTNKDACGPGLFDRTLYLGPDAQSVLKCGSSYFGQMSVTSVDGDKTSDYKLGQGYVNASSKQVTLSGVTGTRVVATTSGLSVGEGGYLDGTSIIQYVFYTNGKTYVAHYIQAPAKNDPSKDVSSDFDLMITNTLKFSK